MSLTRPKITQFDTTATALRDPLTILNSGSAEANVDIGFIMNRSASLSNVALYWSESGNAFSVAFTGNSGITNSNVYVESYANLRAGTGTFDSISTNGFTWTANGDPVALGSVSNASATPPSGPKPGDTWYNTNDNIWYVYQVTDGGNYWVDMYTQTLNPTLITTADISVTGNIIPAGNVTYNLGSPSARWKELYLSGSTIDLNGARITSTNSAITIANPIGGSFEISGSEAGKASATFGNVFINSGVTSTSVYTGALTIDGGVGVLGNVRATSVYTDNLKFANGNPYTSTTLANTAEITANISSGTNAGLSLVATGVVAGNYGSATSIPTIVVDSKGRVTSITSNAVSTTISLAGTSGTGSVAGGGTLTFAGSYGVTATVSGSTITIGTSQDLRTTASPTFASITASGNISGVNYYIGSAVNAATIGNAGAVLTGTLSTAAQTNVTSVGTLTGLAVSGSVQLTNSTASTSTTTGALVVTGGAGIAGALYAGSIQSTPIGNTTASTGAFTTGTFSSTLGVTGATTLSSTLGVTGATTLTTATVGGLQAVAIGNATPGTGAFTTLSASGVTSLTNGTASTTTSTGALVVTGGVGISGAVYAGGIVSASQAGFQSASYNAGRNRIWSFGNADTYGVSYFQGSGGFGGTADMIGMHFGTATAAASQFSFVQNGNFYATGDVYSSYSDDNLKTRTGSIEDPIALIKQIETFYYEPNELALSLGVTAGRKVGLSAQGLLKVLPEAVHKRPDGYLTAQYERLVPLLVETAKKQQELIEQMQIEIANLKNGI